MSATTGLRPPLWKPPSYFRPLFIHLVHGWQPSPLFNQWNIRHILNSLAQRPIRHISRWRWIHHLHFSCSAKQKFCKRCLIRLGTPLTSTRKSSFLVSSLNHRLTLKPSISRPLYLLSYIPSHNRLHLTDKDHRIRGYALSLSVVESYLGGDVKYIIWWVASKSFGIMVLMESKSHDSGKIFI